MNTPAGSVAVGPIVKFTAARIEPDIDGVFLANKANTTIGSAAARDETGIHISGCAHTTRTLLTSVPSLVEMNLDVTRSGCFEHSDGKKKKKKKTIYLPNRTRMNFTTSRTAVAIDGTVVDTMSGQVSVNLDSILKTQAQKCSAVVPVVYANWLDFSSVVEISSVEFFDPATRDQYDRVVFVDVPEMNETCKRAADALENLYNQSVATRKVVVFKPSPPLSKAVMRVPFGVDGSTYDLSSSVVSRPMSIDRISLESMIECAMKLETGFDDDVYKKFASACAKPGVEASRWSGAVANSLSTIASQICAYRIDGRSMLTPTGLKMVAAESWKAEASQTKLETADDCDGTGAHISSIVVDAKKVALDAELSKKYPNITFLANALSLHFVGVAVLAANAGNAGDAGQKGESHVAGHAIALALPKSMVFNSMVVGVLSATQSRDKAESDKLVSSLRADWTSAMFSEDELNAMSEEDKKLVTNSETLSNLHLNAALGEMEALAIEGTSPVSPSFLFSRSPKDRLSRRRVSRNDQKVAELIGPSVARSITQLDVGASNVDTGHVFYKSFVEFLLSPLENLFKSEKLRNSKYATSQLVFCQTNDTSEAGASPTEISTSNFAFLPLWKITEDQGNDLDVALDEVQRNTLPMREGITKLNHESSISYKGNIRSLIALNDEVSRKYKDISLESAPTRMIFAIGSLINNQHAVKVLVDRLRTLSNEGKIAVAVDMLPMKNTILDEENNDVGKFVIVNVKLAA